MIVYKLCPDVDRYRWLSLVNGESPEAWLQLEERPRRDGELIAVEWIEDQLNTGKPKSDFPTLGTTPVFSQRAVEALQPLLTENGELVPLSLPVGERYFAFRTTRVLDALDEDRSGIIRFGSGRILDIRKYEFYRSAFHGEPIFCLPDFRGRVFVTGEFAHRVHEAKLTGFDLQELWCSD